MADPDVSVIIPVRNDAAMLSRLLRDLAGFPVPLDVIVVDGASTDGSLAVARNAGVTIVETQPGRGQQLNGGLAAARCDWIWMLHADSQVTLAALTYIRSRTVPGWGRFDIAFQPDSLSMRLVAAMMNVRSRLSGICTGDQGLFAHRSLLRRIGGVPEQALMEDLELSARLKRLSAPLCPRVQIRTASRRWQRAGVIRTILSMWRLRLCYWAGSSAEALAREYYD